MSRSRIIKMIVIDTTILFFMMLVFLRYGAQVSLAIASIFFLGLTLGLLIAQHEVEEIFKQ